MPPEPLPDISRRRHGERSRSELHLKLRGTENLSILLLTFWLLTVHLTVFLILSAVLCIFYADFHLFWSLKPALTAAFRGELPAARAHRGPRRRTGAPRIAGVCLASGYGDPSTLV